MDLVKEILRWYTITKVTLVCDFKGRIIKGYYKMPRSGSNNNHKNQQKHTRVYGLSFWPSYRISRPPRGSWCHYVCQL